MFFVLSRGTSDVANNKFNQMMGSQLPLRDIVSWKEKSSHIKNSSWTHDCVSTMASVQHAVQPAIIERNCNTHCLCRPSLFPLTCLPQCIFCYRSPQSLPPYSPSQSFHSKGDSQPLSLVCLLNIFPKCVFKSSQCWHVPVSTNVRCNVRLRAEQGWPLECWTIDFLPGARALPRIHSYVPLVE